MNVPNLPFPEFPKIPRHARGATVTEKVDGTNSLIFIADDGQIHAGSRSRWIVPGKQTDNYGFAGWVEANQAELAKLGPGTHYGEWYGAGIQRRYGLDEKRFALFNTERWRDGRQERPACCGVVPVLFEGAYDMIPLEDILNDLRTNGSKIVPGWMQPEGVVIYHHAAKQMFKKLLEGDELPKGLVPYGEKMKPDPFQGTIA